MDSRVKQDHSVQDDAELWRQLSLDEEEFAWAWLSLQCQQISGVVAGLLLASDVAQDDALTPRALWPHSGQDVTSLTEVIEQAQHSNGGVLLELRSGQYGLAYPLYAQEGNAHERLIAVVGVELHAQSEAQLQHAMRQLQWGMAWLEGGYFRQRYTMQGQTLDGLRIGQAVLAATLAETELDAACMAFCGELAAQLGCDRVSIGVLEHDHVRVQALSHSVEPGRKMNLVRCIADAMEESVDQGEVLVIPPLAEEQMEQASVVLAQQKLSREASNGSVMTLPLQQGELCLGAVTLERPADMPFTADELALCRNLSTLAAGVLRDKQLNQQTLWQRMAGRWHQFLVSLLGPGHLRRKLALAGVILLTLFVSLVHTELRVAADAVLRGEVQRAIVAPFAGYLEASGIRPGDRVRQGAEFARLDDHELRLERVKWASQREQYQRQYEEAMASRNRAQ
ncbi:MAG TPA: GAF domain-containing protein, partial [Gammaproteobacteria bacterium]|nr:GAF domain-containing protein [Gammaproteobacteria bacterium]